MKRLLLSLAGVGALLLVSGCGSFRADLVPTSEPRNQAYCQRMDDMAVGLDPYMVKEKTALTFDSDLRCDKVLALSVSMLADGKTTYKVRRDGITASDEFGNSYAPMSAEDAAKRMERWLRHDKPRLYQTVKDRELPDEVTVSNQAVQGFVYFDMKPNKTDSRKFTVMVPATSADGSAHKDFKITVDPYTGEKDPAERWDSYYCSGNPCCPPVTTAAAAPAPTPAAAAPAVSDEAAKRAEDAARRAEDAARRAEEAAKKQQKAFEKGLEK